MGKNTMKWGGANQLNFQYVARTHATIAHQNYVKFLRPVTVPTMSKRHILAVLLLPVPTMPLRHMLAVTLPVPTIPKRHILAVPLLPVSVLVGRHILAVPLLPVPT